MRRGEPLTSNEDRRESRSAVVTFRSKLLGSRCPWIKHGFSTRRGGASAAPYDSLNLALHVGDCAANVLQNRRRFLSVLVSEDVADELSERLVASQQVHGAIVSRAGELAAGKGALSALTSVCGADALWTDRPGLPLIVFCADCVPIVIADERRHVFCVVHAGWRGTASGIAGRAVRTLCSDGRAEDLVAWVAPAIGGCCYEVGDEVAAQIAGASSPSVRSSSGGLQRVDLKLANAIQLAQAGIPRGRIEVAEECTCCLPEMFFSYRRGSITGRMGLAAVISPEYDR